LEPVGNSAGRSGLGSEIYGEGKYRGNSIARWSQATRTAAGPRKPAGDPLTVTPLPPERSEPIAYMVIHADEAALAPALVTGS